MITILKTTLIILLMGRNVNIENLEKYLGRSVKNVEEIEVNKSYNVIGEDYKKYSTSFEKYKFFFFKKTCLTFSFSTNKNDIITSMFFSTKTKINKPFYHLLIEKYGEPIEMIKMGEIIKEEENIHADYIAQSVKAETKTCSFDENPLLIRWDKTNFTLQVQMDYQKNTSFFIFTVK